MILKLYSENKSNHSDLKLLGKNNSRYNLYFSKFIVSIVLAFSLMLLIIIFSAIIMAILQVNNITILSLSISNIFGLLINIFFIYPILILLAIWMRKPLMLLMGLLICLIFSISSIASNLICTNINKCNNIEKNINAQDAYVQYDQVSVLNENNKYLFNKFLYSYTYTLDPKYNLNTDILNSINYINKLNFLWPGSITLSIQEGIFSAIHSVPNLNNYLMYKTSLSRIVPNNIENISSFLNKNYSYIIMNMNDNNLFNLQTIDLTNKLLSDISYIYNRYFDLINNTNEIKGLNDSLLKSNLWNLQNYNNIQLNLLSELLGTQNSDLFYIWYYNEYFNNNIGNLINIIANKYNLEFANLINYLWNTNSAYINLILINQNSDLYANELKNYLLSKYPIGKYINSSIMGSKKDIDFISNDLVKIQQTPSGPKISILNNDLTYWLFPNNIDNQFIMHFKNLKTLNTQQDWINYITKDNIPTASFLNNIYNELSILNQNIIKIRLDNLNFNNDLFNGIFDLTILPMNSNYISNIIVEIMLCFILFYISFYKYNKLNY